MRPARPAGSVGPDGELRDDQADNAAHSPWECFLPGTTHQVGWGWAVRAGWQGLL